ncbi:hypothetical protein [Sinorhizobium meliloti]|uniref:hypothetical protein n=1 Tax=Rhizobium meliloti TaxID=382 RepID=UPI000B4A35C5|nr:hypothetical protein [Sinorhizobium meliloti]ASP64386.1 hypothetical protein CDO29_07170 [Sinorhizobium meliloti]MDW9709960.1 hypothetical protein [Sinorhizobium meliloti]MDW9746803.1 hypothetical protein [Sinorhizobium meliloti]MDW9891151.1 hypothetical protein [Sinorhizobium meliloti]MDX0094180.1 hypothetical protein [Sinorhizobium meliloti]
MKFVWVPVLAGCLLWAGQASAAAWLYEKDVIVTARGPIAACDTPTSVDEFSALLKLNDYDAILNYPHCQFMLDPPKRAITIEGYDIYIKLMTTIDGQPKTFWTRKGIFRTEKDWIAADCHADRESKGAPVDECFELNDRANWQQD